MRKLLFICLLLPFISKAQVKTKLYVGGPLATNVYRGPLGSDSALYIMAGCDSPATVNVSGFYSVYRGALIYKDTCNDAIYTSNPNASWTRIINSNGDIFISGDTVIINKIRIKNLLNIPQTDTTNAIKGCGNLIYDTINEHFYGDKCVNGVHNYWACFDCGYNSVNQLNDSTYTICRLDGTCDTIQFEQGPTLLLQTNGTNNGSQTLLNLQQGSNVTLADNGSGQVTISATTSGGSANSNIGAGYRWAVPNTNNIKTIFPGYGLLIDSTTNANALTATVDSATLSNKYLKIIDTSQLGRNYIDVFGVGGQSNASGGSQKALFVVPHNQVLQFKNETFSDANDPVNNADSGSAWPSFGVNYYKISGHKLVFVGGAQQGSSQAAAAIGTNGTWDTTGVLFDTLIARINRAVTKLQALGYTPIIRGILWSQGEQDASKINSSTITQATYIASLRKMIGRFRSNYTNIPFYIFRTGKDTTSSVSDVGFQAVRDGQQIVCNGDSLTNIVFWNALDFPRRGWMNDNLHYNRAGNTEMGRIGAENIIASSGMKWQSLNDTGSVNMSMYYMGGKVGFLKFNPAFNIDVTGTGRFTDTLRDDMILSLSDSSYDVPNTAWIKRQSFATGTPATPGGPQWAVQVNNSGSFYGSDSLIWNPVNRHVDIYNSRTTFSTTSDSIYNSINLINLNAASAGLLTQNSPGIRFTAQAWRTTATAGSWTSHWLIRMKAVTGATATSSNLQFMSADGNTGTPNISPTGLTERASIDGAGNVYAGAALFTNGTAGTGTTNANNLTGVGNMILSTTSASSYMQFGKNGNIMILGTTNNVGINSQNSQNNSFTDAGATFFTYRSGSAAGLGSATNTASGTTVTGTSSKFLDFYRIGDQITMAGEARTISAIASNTSMTTDAWTAAHTGVAYSATNAKTGLVAMGNGLIGIDTLPNPGSTKGNLLFAVGNTNYAPIQLNAGTLLTTPASGIIETNSNNELYYSTSTTTASRGFVRVDKYLAKTASYTATANDETIDFTSGTDTLTLPTAVGIAGRTYTVVNSGANTCKINTTSSQTFVNINTAPTILTLNPVGAAAITSYTVKSNGANWIVIAKVKDE